MRTQNRSGEMMTMPGPRVHPWRSQHITTNHHLSPPPTLYKHSHSYPSRPSQEHGLRLCRRALPGKRHTPLGTAGVSRVSSKINQDTLPSPPAPLAAALRPPVRTKRQRRTPTKLSEEGTGGKEERRKGGRGERVGWRQDGGRRLV